MRSNSVSSPTLKRLPIYLDYLRTVDSIYISSAAIASALGLGEVLVRKDLSQSCGGGKPKIGYVVSDLVKNLEEYFSSENMIRCIIIGAGSLGKALINDTDGFRYYGIEISGAFDIKSSEPVSLGNDRFIYPISELESYCAENQVNVGIITVPENAAQQVCDMLVKNNIKAVWNFARCELDVPDDVIVKNEDLYLSLACLKTKVNIKNIIK